MDDAATGQITTLRPGATHLDQLLEPLNEAESQVARTLARLRPGWTVYVEPRIGLDRPDFVAVHDRHGVCAIEVKSWLPHSVRQNDDGEFEFVDASGQWTRSNVQPRFEASRYRSTIFDQFYALPEDGGSPGSEIRSIVVLPYFSTEQATHLFERLGVHDGERSVAVWGADALERVDEMVEGMGCPVPHPESMRRLREGIVASERVEIPEPERSDFSPGVREVADNPSGLRARRIRGAAGAGKSFALAARAARLAAEGKSVLMLSFNVTLANRLRSMASERCREVGANPTSITCANFHTFCTRVVQDAEVAGFHLEAPSGVPWTTAIVAKVQHAFDTGFRCSYDAVLIDEGQDFSLDWWQLLRNRVLAPDGEMVIAVDPTQDLYGRSDWTDDDSAAGSGLSGPWIELTENLRLPADIVEFANRFARDRLVDEETGATTIDVSADSATASGRTSAGSVRRWTDVERVNDLGRMVGREVVRVLQENPTLTPGDVAFVCDYHHDGVAAVRVIEGAGFPVHHIFSRDPDAPRRRRKHRFWPSANAVKGCTIHSFKGWESSALVLGIGSDSRAHRIAHVSLTRLAATGDGRPSVVSVVNADRRLMDLAESFEADSQLPAPALRPAPPTPLAVPPPAPRPLEAPTAFAAPALVEPFPAPVERTTFAPPPPPTPSAPWGAPAG